MKKLLVLMLVFAMATVASATPTITVSGVAEITPGGDAVTVSISGTYAEASGGTAGNSNTPAGGTAPRDAVLDLSNTGISYK